MYRKMRNNDYRLHQWNNRYSGHIELVNQLVDKLRLELAEDIPYVAPSYGGTKAKVLLLLQDPGPKTNLTQNGSGFISTQNDDPTAEVLGTLLDKAQIALDDVIAWNACVHYIGSDQKKPSAKQLQHNLKPLAQLIELLPKLQVVILMGRVAEDSWSRFSGTYPHLASKICIFECPHPSKRGLMGSGPNRRSRQEGLALVMKALENAKARVC